MSEMLNTFELHCSHCSGTDFDIQVLAYARLTLDGTDTDEFMLLQELVRLDAQKG